MGDGDGVLELIPTAVMFPGQGSQMPRMRELVAAGSLDERDALRLVVLRGLLMSTSGEDAGGGTMLAVLGATPAQAAALAARNGVAFANDNAPGQAVLSGSPAALAVAREDALGDGLRTAELDVAAGGVQSFVDAGPGRVLAKLAPRCVPGAGAASLDMLLGDLEESRAA
jgi:malonyl CoA-acyl carrier protein transacylase